jgi:hypothetical protein
MAESIGEPRSNKGTYATDHLTNRHTFGARRFCGHRYRADDESDTGFEVRSFAGAFVPTGDQRNDFKTATMLGAQVAHEFSEHLHLLGSFAWTHGHNKFANLNDDRTFIWQYDAGVELNLVREINDDWLFRPLVGVGVGARTYDYAAAGVGSNTCSAGYASVGSELQRGTVAVRFDARDYLNCFKSPFTGVEKTRNDIGLTLGLVYHIR